MGDLQTYFYLALISVVMIGLTLTFVGIAAAGLWRWFKRAHGQTPPLTGWWAARLRWPFCSSCSVQPASSTGLFAMARRDPRRLSRRQFALLGTQVAGAVVTVLLGIPIVGFILSPIFRRQQAVWREVGDMTGVPDREPTKFEI